MRHRLASIALLSLVLGPVAGQPPDDGKSRGSGRSQPAADEATPAGSAMSTIFSPSRVPQRKTMGLLQRSFLDLADQGDQELEVAIVVDGTDSMATELAGVRRSIHQMLDDLRRYRDNEVRTAIVVYRDAGSPSGGVVIPLQEFTSDKQRIAGAVDSLQPESGAPFFHELPDLGLHRALTELPWSDDNQVTKWILMFGDAPPYAESYRDSNTPEAYRRYATALLVSLAKQKNIRINCVLCTSSDNIVEPYDQAIDQTRGFMNALCTGTDGLMLDLSIESIRNAMLDAGKQPDVQLAQIEPISAIDLEAVRRPDLAAAGNSKPVSLAVLPHMPWNKMSFDARDPAVQVSTALRTKFATLPGVRVASPRDIKEQLRRLRAEGITGAGAIRGLAARLGVDFVVWGSLAPDHATVQTAAYRRDDGRQIAAVKLAQDSGEMAYELIQASARGAPDDQALSQLLANARSLQSAMVEPTAQSAATSAELLTAIESLDQALGYEAGSDQAVELLATADRASRNATTAEPRNALAHWLQANVAHNQASRFYRLGDSQAAAARMRDMRASLREAVTSRQRLSAASLVTEIEADYYLLIQRETDKAVERYMAMTKPDQPIKTQLRGHWMLAGIYAGDWGTAEQPIVDPEKARRHVIEILANWADSPEAKLLKQWLRWDEATGQTEFNYLPRRNVELTGA